MTRDFVCTDYYYLIHYLTRERERKIAVSQAEKRHQVRSHSTLIVTLATLHFE